MCMQQMYVSAGRNRIIDKIARTFNEDDACQGEPPVQGMAAQGNGACGC